jgi:hypothetical protein
MIVRRHCVPNQSCLGPEMAKTALAPRTLLKMLVHIHNRQRCLKLVFRASFVGKRFPKAASFAVFPKREDASNPRKIRRSVRLSSVLGKREKRERVT